LKQVETRLNWNSVSHLFTFLSTPASESIVEGIHKLEPAHLLIARPGSEAVTERYWSCEFNPDYSKTEEYFIERLRELLEESVRLRLVSDVPLGAFLSGGIDSSAVVAMMAKLSPGQVKTFSIGFNEADYSELRYAGIVADRFSTEHHELTLEPNILDSLDRLAWYLDEPFGDSSAIPTYMVSKIAAEHVTVLLSGDGGDEIFAGYEKYIAEASGENETLTPYARRVIRALGNLIPDGVRGRNYVRHMALFGPERYLDSATLFRGDEKRRLFRPEVYQLFGRYDPWRWALDRLQQPHRPWLSTLQSLDLNSYLPLDILAKVDRMSMANSVEARAPLLDHKLVEFAATIPPELQLKDGTTKYIFKKSMRGILPDKIIDRRKHGFAVPLGSWFRGKLAGYAHELLLSETSRKRGIFNPGYISRLIKRQQKGRELDLHLWTLISFELWCRTFLDSRSAGFPPIRDRSNADALTYSHSEA
jgi:asparagine synthase (glutamine-hydrolysing)